MTPEERAAEVGDRVTDCGEVYVIAHVHVAAARAVLERRGRARTIPLGDLVWDEVLDTWIIITDPEGEEEAT